MSQSESMEMYLKTILILEKRNEVVRSVDIAREMNFSKPSVSRAMDKLKDEELVRMDEKNLIFLTDKGRKIAEKIYERNRVVSKYFEDLGVSKEVAIQDACAIEHVISDETFRVLKKHYEEEHDL